MKITLYYIYLHNFNDFNEFFFLVFYLNLTESIFMNPF